MSKSIVRINVEKSLTKVGVDINKPSIVFKDKRKDYDRIKFSRLFLNDTQINNLRKELRSIYPNNDIRIEVQTKKSRSYMGRYNGTVVYVYH